MVASSQAPTGPEYEEQFLRILNNLGKYESPPSSAPREHGFVVLVRGSSSLKPLQDLCLNKNRQTRNSCFTARYRLLSSAALGTLLASYFGDLRQVTKGAKAIAGDLRPNSSDEKWKGLAAPIQVSSFWTGLLADGKPAGEFDRNSLRSIFGVLSDESLLRVGERLVLFGELSEEAVDATDWQTAAEILFRELPERMGIVLSGAPRDFILPRDDPHFLEIAVPRDYAGTAEQSQFAYRFTESSFHSDVPAEKDELGVADYANAIARFVLHPQTKPPLTIGIHGPWGKGKSSFMNLVNSALIRDAKVNNEEQRNLKGASRTQRWNDLTAKQAQLESEIQLLMVAKPEATKEQTENDERTRKAQQLANDEAKDEADELWQTMKKKAERNIVSIRFNAWQFEDAKQTWAGLASQISDVIEQSLHWHSQQWLKIRYAWKEHRSELILNLLLPLAVVGLVTALVVLGFFRHVIPTDKTPSSILLWILFPTSSALFAIWLISSQVLKAAAPISERVLQYVRMPDYREQMGFQNRVKDDLKFLYEFLIARRPGCRVVVYIDDLDRCSENKIMELLQAINLILANCEFFVFMAMDTEMIYRAINNHYPGSKPIRFAENYLRKIVQISFFLPPDTLADVRLAYLGALFSAAARVALRIRKIQGSGAGLGAPTAQIPAPTNGRLSYDLSHLLKIIPVQVREAEDTADELEAFGDYSEFVDDNPREVKRLINIHRLTKILLQRQNTPWSIERQRKLVKWMIFCDRWPDLVDDVLELRRGSQSQDLLNDLAAKVENDQKERPSTNPAMSLGQLKAFACFAKESTEPALDVLSAADVDEDFRRAAKLSQLVNELPPVATVSARPAPRTPAPSKEQPPNYL